MIGSDDDAGLPPVRQGEKAAEEPVYLLEVAFRDIAVVLVVAQRNRRQAWRSERREDMPDRIGALQVDQREVRGGRCAS